MGSRDKNGMTMKRAEGHIERFQQPPALFAPHLPLLTLILLNSKSAATIISDPLPSTARIAATDTLTTPLTAY